MPNTYSQISIQCVFAVKGRESLIHPEWQDELHRYIAGIMKNEGATVLAVGGSRDHIHIFFGMPVTMKIPDFMSIVKSNSSKWINEKGFIQSKFHWQSGYGAFSYSKNQRDNVINNIMRQEEHHQALTFRDEYLAMLKEFDINYDEQYLFEFY